MNPTRQARSHRFTRGLLFLLLAGSFSSVAGAEVEADAESAPSAREAMVVTANPHATAAGAAVLARGGSAVDAAIAIESVLSLVEPQSSGLGGGGFLTYFDAKDRRITVFDGREVAPAGATADLFLDPEGNPYGYLEAKNSGLSIGVPGAVAMLALAHETHGQLPWNGLFERAIELAEDGFDVSPRLGYFLQAFGGRLIPKTREEGPLDAYHYFFDESGEAKTRLTNPAYAETLRILADDPGALYRGPLAEAIAAAAALEPRAGTLTVEDIAAYRPRAREPLCFDYRRWRACGPPPPASWVGVGMMLGILEASEFPGEERFNDWAILTEAQRLAYADRDHFVADDSFVDVPLAGLLNKDYLAGRAAQIDPLKAAEQMTPGDPWKFEERALKAAQWGADTTIDYAGTTHFVVVDGEGNVVSMTATVESIFGSTRMAGGMFLNNQLTDFAKQPRDEADALVANHPAAGKRPRSSMSPTIVLDDSGDFFMATGSPGGNSILAYTLKTLVGVLDWGLTPQEAVNLPNVVARGDVVRIESERASPEFIADMRARGFTVKESAGENSGLSVVIRQADGTLLGGVDPRREGTIERVPAP